MHMSNILAIVGAEGTGSDVWVTRLVLISGLITTAASGMVAVIRAGKANDKLDAAATQMAKRLDSAEATIEQHHVANTARLDQLGAKLDAAALPPAAPQ